MTTIAFFGLGKMGAPMALNLAAAGHEVIGCDPVLDAPDGVTKAADAASAVARAEVVVLSLPDGFAVHSVLDAVVDHAPAGTLFIDSSTTQVDQARAAADRCAAAGHAFLDAPVSGGTKGAAAGTLTFMVGGAAYAFARAGAVLDILGARAIHCGPPGCGQAAKICNNMLLGITMAGACEAIAMAEKLGLDGATFFDVASTSSGQCWSLNTYCPLPGVGPQSPADNDYTPGFSTKLMLKDLELSQAAASAAAAASPMGARAAQLYREFAGAGGEGRDFSAMVEHLRRK